MTTASENNFVFRGTTFQYFYQEHNMTWATERAVEIPIVAWIFSGWQGKRILEVGNVLSQYFPVEHDIVDKYEQAPGVINVDVVDYQPSEKYDLIISISTLEHVGWDEEPKEPVKVLAAIENLKNCLAPAGRIVVTLPIGYNPHLDRLINENKLQFTRQYFLKRVSDDNKWVQAEWEDVKNAQYNYPFPFANGVIIGIIDKGNS